MTKFSFNFEKLKPSSLFLADKALSVARIAGTKTQFPHDVAQFHLNV